MSQYQTFIVYLQGKIAEASQNGNFEDWQNYQELLSYWQRYFSDQ